MWAALREITREVGRLGLDWGQARWAQWQAQLLTRLAQERQRLFEALLLLAMGLLLCALGLAGLLLLAWTVLPEHQRSLVLALALLLLVAAGLRCFAVARRRLDTP